MNEEKDELCLFSFEVIWEKLDTCPMQEMMEEPRVSQVVGVRYARSNISKEGARGGLLWGYSLEVTDRTTYRTEGWSFWSDWSGWTDTETESRVGWFKVSRVKIRRDTAGRKPHTGSPGKELQINRTSMRRDRGDGQGRGTAREKERERLEKNRTECSPLWCSTLTMVRCEANRGQRSLTPPYYDAFTQLQ